VNRTAYSVPVIAGLAKDYPNMTEWLDQNLRPEKAKEFRKAYTQCYDSNWDAYPNRSIGIYLKDGYDSLFSPIPSSILKSAATLGNNGVPKVPMYIFMVSEYLWM
jgi:hypothetical protein